MLRDPELREAYEVISKLPTFYGDRDSVVHSINELTSRTMLLLRAVDKLQDDYRNDLRDFRTFLQQVGKDIALLQAHNTHD